MARRKNEHGLTAREAHLVDTYVFKYKCNPKYQADSIRESYNVKDDFTTFSMVSEYFAKPLIQAEITRKKRYCLEFETPENIYADIMEARDSVESVNVRKAYDEMRVQIAGMITNRQEVKTTDIDLTEQAEKALKAIRAEYNRMQDAQNSENSVTAVKAGASNGTETRENTLGNGERVDIPVIGTVNAGTDHVQNSTQSSKDAPRDAKQVNTDRRKARSMLLEKVVKNQGGRSGNDGSPLTGESE